MKNNGVIVTIHEDSKRCDLRVCDTLTFCNLNIAHGRGTASHQILLSDKIIKRNLERIAHFLTSISADIIGLQEVDIKSFWNGNFEHAPFLANHMQEIHCSITGEHMSFKKLRYGTALISKLSHKNAVSRAFKEKKMLLPKGYLISEFCWPGKPQIVFDVISVHLDFLSSRIRKKQLSQLINEVKERNNAVIILGDLNSQWQDKNSAVKEICEKLNLSCYDASNRGLTTFNFPKRRWDWILLSDKFHFIEYAHGPIGLSDHVPVYAKVGCNV